MTRKVAKLAVAAARLHLAVSECCIWMDTMDGWETNDKDFNVALHKAYRAAYNLEAKVDIAVKEKDNTLTTHHIFHIKMVVDRVRGFGANNFLNRRDRAAYWMATDRLSSYAAGILVDLSSYN